MYIMICIEICVFIVETDDTIFILATTYYRSKRVYQAYWLLREKARRSPECRFLYARTAYELKKYAEAENALTSMLFGDLICNLEDVAKEFGEIACFALHLIAQICIKTERSRIASVALRRALSMNPFMWDAYALLCKLGEYPDVGSIFQITSTDIFCTSQGNLNVNAMVICGGTSNNFNTMDNSSGMDCASSCNNPTNTANISPASAAMGFSSYIGNNPPDTMFQTPLDNISTVFIPGNGNNTTSTTTTNTVMISAPAISNNENNSSICSTSIGGAGTNTHNVSGVTALHDVTTPNNYINNSNIPSSIMLLRGMASNTTAGLNNNGSNNNSICSNQSLMQSSSSMMLSETPNANARQLAGSNIASQLNTSGGNSIDINTCTPLFKSFNQLSAQMPGTPSFGVLPINSPLSADATIAQFMNSCLLQGSNLGMPNQMNVGGINVQSPQTLAEVNQEPKNVGKKLKTGHCSSTLITRKDVNAPNSSSNSTTKPAVFTQTGNITPRTPINSNTTINIPTGNYKSMFLF